MIKFANYWTRRTYGYKEQYVKGEMIIGIMAEFRKGDQTTEKEGKQVISFHFLYQRL